MSINRENIYDIVRLYKDYDYLKLFIINSLLNASYKVFDTNTEYKKLYHLNNDIGNIVIKNNIYKFFNSVVDKKNTLKDEIINISQYNIVCSFFDNIYNDVLKNIKIDNLLFITTEFNVCDTLKLFDNSNNIDFLLTPHKYLFDKKFDVTTSINNKYKSKFNAIGGYSINDLKNQINVIKSYLVKSGDKSKSTIYNIDKYYDVSICMFRSGLNLCAPNIKFVINSGTYFILLLISIIKLKTGCPLILQFNSYMTPFLSKTINLVHNIFTSVKYYSLLDEDYLICDNLTLTIFQRIELTKLIIHLVEKEKILDTYIEYDEFLSHHIDSIINNKQFYYTLPKNIIESHLKKYKPSNKKILFINDIYFTTEFTEIEPLFKFTTKSNSIIDRIHNKSIGNLIKINNFIIDHDIKFGEGNYDIDDEFITKVLFDKYTEIIATYREFDIPYNKAYDVFISKQRSLLLDRYLSFNSNINTRLIKYQTPDLRIATDLASYFYDDITPFYKQIDNSYIVRNNIIELVNKKFNPNRYIPGRDEGIVPEIITRIFSQYTRGISAYLSENFPVPPEISNVKTVSNGFCKLWEIYHVFGIFDDCKRKGIEPNVFHFCEAPGQWIIATRYFISKRFPQYMHMPVTNSASPTSTATTAKIDKKQVGGGGGNKSAKRFNKKQSKKRANKSSNKSPIVKSLLKSLLSPIYITRKLSRKQGQGKGQGQGQRPSKNVLNRGKIFKGRGEDKYQKQPDIIADYKWIANSLNPNCDLNYRDFGNSFTIKDDYKIIKSNVSRWLWGVDNSGNICRSINIKWYRDYFARTGKTTLVTGDAGITTDAPAIVLQQLEIAQMVMVMATCGVGGSCVIKHFTPYMKSEPTGSIKSFGTFYNMIYTYYQMFDYVSLFKPYCSNPNSGEFYIIGKGFCGISDKNLDALYHIIDNFQLNTCWIPEKDIPHKFVQQVNNFLGDMAEFNKFALDSSSLTLTCLYNEDKEFRSLSGCNDFLDEKKLYSMQVQQFKHWIREHNFA